jgi:hypothetical protein
MNVEPYTGEVRSCLQALASLGLFLVPDREQRDRHVGRVSEVSLTHGSECHVHHLLDDIIQGTSNYGSGPRCREVNGYLHLNLAIVQAMSQKWVARVDEDRPVVAESYECTQQHSREARAVSSRGPKIAVLIEGAVGKSVMFICENRTQRHY